ncbi:hypothetical protein D3875_12595 [Deinococcus cavernae]|uniref:YvlB/LiaX N-terminal domain-containing protein n=1 Tax=Deinococcus cavernae TaxID=2320857 RepID=A0A418V849_9DEIO|nr:hypothetical protein [Deinococcus cavernae]RJF72268.1 hypothetical protein D3875_12595 [Deinococcus cavernae]
MKEKIKRILDLIRSGKLSLDDAAPLLAALNTRLALQTTDRELLDSLLNREDIDTAQIAEHLMLLRGLKDTPPTPPQPPRPPRPPGFPFEASWAERAAHAEREAARAERHAQRGRRAGGIEGMVERITDTVERAVDSAMEGVERTVIGTPSYSYAYDKQAANNRILRIEAQSEDGNSYDANLPMSLAPHLHKLIPEHGRAALEKAGMTIEALQLIIEAEPPTGKIIDAQDEDGNSVSISIR